MSDASPTRFRALGALILLGLLATVPVRGQLLLEIDAANDRLRFSGSENITFGPVDVDVWGAFWGEEFTDSGNQQELDLAGAFHFGSAGDFIPLLGVDFGAGTAMQGFLMLGALSPSDPSGVLVSGTGNWLSYESAFAAGNISILESWPGQSLASGEALNTDLNISAVPEPSTYALILGALCLGGVLWRRHRRY